MRICILGGGFAGLYTALHLSRKVRSWPVRPQIILVEPQSNFLFTPLLYEHLSGELLPWEIAPRYATLLHRSGIEVWQDAVQTVHFPQRQVNLQSGRTLTYDYLVLAVGQATQLSGVPGVERYAQTFQTLADSEHLRHRLRHLCARQAQVHVAIVGAGPNGVELACKLADYGGQQTTVTLIDRGNRIVSAFPATVQKAAYQALQARGVQLELETSIERVEVQQILLRQSDCLFSRPADIVIWVAGTQPHNWVRSLDVTTQADRLCTTPSLQLVDYPEVFALGDLATIDGSSASVPATAQAATQQATIAARNLAACLQGQAPVAFHYQHQGDMMTLGMGTAIVATPFFCLTGRWASAVRLWAYVLRLPTLPHKLHVARYELMQALRHGRQVLRQGFLRRSPWDQRSSGGARSHPPGHANAAQYSVRAQRSERSSSESPP